MACQVCNLCRGGCRVTRSLARVCQHTTQWVIVNSPSAVTLHKIFSYYSSFLFLFLRSKSVFSGCVTARSHFLQIKEKKQLLPFPLPPNIWYFLSFLLTFQQWWLLFGISIRIPRHKAVTHFTVECKDITQKLHPKQLQTKDIQRAIPLSQYGFPFGSSLLILAAAFNQPLWGLFLNT